MSEKAKDLKQALRKLKDPNQARKIRNALKKKKRKTNKSLKNDNDDIVILPFDNEINNQDDKVDEDDITNNDDAEDLKAILERYEKLQQRAVEKVKETFIEDFSSSSLEGKQELRERLAEDLEEGRIANSTDNIIQIQKNESNVTISKLSKKRLKELIKPSISELKFAAPRPDVVETWDVSAPNPELLVWLKSYKNTVKVPSHWNQKRRYLSGKRAIEKPPFRLPDYLEATKVGEIRAAILEREAQKSVKQKQREKTRPKSNRMHIDFQVLHDAFFKYATLPSDLSKFGDLYYEGKEREEKSRKFKPGKLSSRLKEALGILLPSNPPPWLLLMQRYGPPPSYPNLRIPGLNAPIPPGAVWGFNAGEWGRAPCDQHGNPLYPTAYESGSKKANANTTSTLSGDLEFWGEASSLKKEEEEEEDGISDDEEEEEDAPMDAEDIVTKPSPKVEFVELTIPKLLEETYLEPPPLEETVVPGSVLGGLLTQSAFEQEQSALPYSVAKIKEQLKEFDEINQETATAAGQISTAIKAKKKKKANFKF